MSATVQVPPGTAVQLPVGAAVQVPVVAGPPAERGPGRQPRHAAPEPPERRAAHAGGTPADLVIAPSEERVLRRVRLIDSETAGAVLAAELKQAYTEAGSPGMGELGDAIVYSKATVSRVLSGKMHPKWTFVDRFAVVLGVPQEIVTRQWRPLWIAADLYRQKTGAPRNGPGRSDSAGFACELCGAWAVDFDRHADWHADCHGGRRPAAP
ncbi:helix-turn-helix domain-containing protein [Spirilliplanes yamanashiensis]|uniref:Uncharacterized protein n=1 Tax=Spirilliplanes yamanashiensis TaxID=42233 RepID=A0A8J4DI71_9ACTN|nr:helix-turn-helix transcriptional regulator [Spirilliplanes yamanashiensis]MDP9819468.1 hypothetical protein [Spirilliplanes yamanashiensis]GIJ01710.1 hypothetical protein Sya03_10620 [Spirilliplanes yamanashiensis]